MKTNYIRKSKLILLLTIACFASATRRVNAQGAEENTDFRPHIVKKGETLYGIVTNTYKLDNIYINYTEDINKIKDSKIYVGQKLMIPICQESHFYGLHIGIDYTTNASTPQLSGSKNDAHCLFQEFLMQENNTYYDVISEDLYNQEACYDSIKYYIKDFATKAVCTNDVLCVTWSGHIIIQDGNPYLVTYQYGTRSNAKETLISPDTLSSWLKHPENPRLKVLLVLDNCQSQRFAMHMPTAGLNIGIFSAAESNQKAHELLISSDEKIHEDCSSQHYHGVLSHLILEGLSGAADANKDSIIHYNELCAYITTTVQVDSNYTQNPHVTVSFIPNFIIATIPKEVTGSPPPQKTERVRSSEMKLELIEEESK